MNVRELLSGRAGTMARCVLAGLCLAGSVPPWGWWPLAFVGIAVVDGLIDTARAKARFGRMWLVTVAWLYPAMLWMWDLAAPGYMIAGAFFGCYLGAAAALTPAGPLRRLVFPGAFAVAELARWSWPFGGVPLAHLGLSQVNTPVGQVARLAGPAFVVLLVIVGGQALAAAFKRQRHAALVGFGVLAVFIVAAALHPRANVVDTVEAAVVQGGGPQRTRAAAEQQPVVLARHVEASQTIVEPVDLILWPENVVNPGRLLDRGQAYADVVGVAERYQAPLLAGWFEAISETNTANYQSVINPGGTETDRYDKVRLVPFGEFVPLRGLAEWLAVTVTGTNPLPARDVQVGTVEPLLDTPVGPVGVSISWESYFEHRARHSVREGAQLLTNPTNGSSFWLTMVQTQQVASNQLRAIENDRWVLMAAPTGLSAIVDPDGKVLQRSDVSERTVLQATVEMREGRTLHSYLGWWPVLIYGLAVIGYGLVRTRSGATRPAEGAELARM